MPTSRSGYMLIELMLYSALLITALVMAMSYAVQSHLQTSSYYQRAALYAHMMVVLDRLVDDLLTAPASLSTWKLVTPTAHIWYNGVEDVGWQTTAEGIVRLQGRYTSSEKRWTTKSISFFHPALSYTLEPLQMVCNATTLLCVTVCASQEQLKATRMVSVHQGSML
jgi:hypothetical protein